MLRPLTVWITTNWIIVTDRNTGQPYLYPEKPVFRARRNSYNLTWKNSLVQNWEMNISSLYVSTAYSTSMHSTSCEMPGWMNHKPESRLPGEISKTSDMQMIPGGGHSNPLQHSRLENPINRGAWGGHWVAKSQKQLKWLSTYMQKIPL